MIVSVSELHNADVAYHKVFEGMRECTRMIDRVHLPDRFRMPDIGKPDVGSTYYNRERGVVPTFHLLVGGEPLRVWLLER